MANSFFSFCLALSLIATPVLAGNRAWEPPIRGGHTTEELSFQDPLAFTEQNETSSRRSLSPQKRWITIKPGKNSADAKLWPNREITYCFETAAARTGTFDDLKNAKQLWTNSGLSEAFKWTQGSDSFCADTSNRSKFLLIKFDSNGGMGTTVGLPALLEGSTAGPTMRLTDSLEMGMMNVVANYAHEMGHAWGMHHEHQNERFWGEGYSESGGTYWGPERWNCQNLKDYTAVLDKLIAAKIPKSEAEAKMNQACKNRAKALAINFSAFDYLPILDEPVNASNKEEPDWDSIMIYPSGAGGTGSASGGDDQRLPILLKPDGSRIEKVYKPSERDIKGLTDLYGGALSAKLTLLGDKSNPAKSLFDKLRKKDKDSGCS